eukprot:CAMPEP_0203745724 /NCGR_PEP_ID=MMETSP0098-20131031/1377_1 /ASSEMBLY_ACC=CAM_ASM_000208 /TAXON_ID=96639 /ORGANISM=" , Strain NY0313808BC1" /LENGTH=633 /DNA_ID=CAMNT_0050633589 /DNA_START=208 /DNA_END=2109 /DNA_ORIENTATION=-
MSGRLLADDCGEDGYDQVEEELIRRMFGTRTESIGSDSEPVEQNVGSVASTTVSMKYTNKQLQGAEKMFLEADTVRSENVPLDNVASRFTKSTVPENPLNEEEVVEKYMDGLISGTIKDSVNTASPRMIGHMTSSLPYFMRPLSRLVTTMNQNVVKTETANTVTFLEREAMAQLHRQIYKMEDAFYQAFSQNAQSVLGVFTSGGTVANVTALWAARNVALCKTGEFAGIESQGLVAALLHHGYKGCAVIGSKLLHYSMGKAMDVLGFGSSALIEIEYDSDFRVKVDLLEVAVKKCKDSGLLVVAVVGIAGATETGSIDDLEAIAKVAKEHSIHFHVDAAWGGPCVFSARYGPLLKGIEQADSVTLDGHKQLYMPMGCGLCFFKDPSLSKSVQKTARYIIRNDSYDLGKFTLEGSRPANAIFLHSNLNIFGVRGYEILVDRSVRMVKYMAKRIVNLGGWFELVVKPMTNILLYRAIPPELRQRAVEKSMFSVEENEVINQFNVRLQEEQKLEGRTFVSRTTVHSVHHGSSVVGLRVVVANPLTCERDIDVVLQNQLRIIGEMCNIDKTELPVVFEETVNTASLDVSGQPEQPPKDMAFWHDYWKTMPAELKKLFKDDENVFTSSLVAPGAGVLI